ncbi:MAG: DUF3800 domain-containing protein [Prevotella sp.]|nr:DUF3800 domain-containing protein [Prevotella sp.]MBR6494901.1 DUF3800 domain-containing protein [Prevotella sp.]
MKLTKKRKGKAKKSEEICNFAGKLKRYMYYIWTDESDATGKYYANFYGGILIRSEHYEEVRRRLSAVVKKVGLENEEIKWQKVNEYTEERYERIVDVLFALLSEDKAKIRIFFRHRQFESIGLPNELRRKEYPKLYYQFIKNDFGLIYSNPKGKSVRVRLLIDDMPLKGPDREEFLKAIYHLNELKTFQKAGIIINDGDVAEVNSKKHLPLQAMDVVLGAMCFRLNDKHKERGIDGKRAKRNIVKEKLYKYIRTKIWELHPGFNIGVTTPITRMSDLWERPYLHWNFVPRNFTKNEKLTKRHKTETAPYNLHK